jgi:hypothetical protein
MSNIEFMMNDLSTPHLRKVMDIPQSYPENPAFKVEGFNGKSGEVESATWQAAQVQSTMALTLNFYYPVTPRKLGPWPGTNVLKIVPRGGKDFNAYYDRRHLMFFHDRDPIRNKEVYTCDSVDIVAHELGHAILDNIRPDLRSCPTIESWSFHEAFADLIAFLAVMQQDEILVHMLGETNNTIETSNVVSRLSEDMAIAIGNMLRSKGMENPPYGADGLRNAINNFAYVRPETLPDHAHPDDLACEPHSFGRVFLGAFYDILVGIYKKGVASGNTPIEALKHARYMLSYLTAQAITAAPLVPNFYDAVAKAMLQIDKNIGSPNADVLVWAFKRRKLVKFTIKAMSNLSLKDLNTNNYEVTENEDGVILRKNTITTFKMADHFGLRAQSLNPLLSAEVEAPAQSYMRFDKNGVLQEEITASKKDIVNSLKAGLKYINKAGLYSEGQDSSKPFILENGKLVRNFIQ